MEEVLNRIYVLNAIDGLLTFVDESEVVDVSYYIGSISGKIFSSISSSSQSVRLVTDFQDGVLSRVQAQALAIIINEFITNSFKYAFKDSGGVLKITIQFDATSATVDLIDDGPGFPADAVNGLGTQIIQAMAGQINADAQWVKGAGAHLQLVVPTSIPLARTT